MKAIVVTDQAAGTAGMKLAERRRGMAESSAWMRAKTITTTQKATISTRRP